MNSYTKEAIVQKRSLNVQRILVVNVIFGA